MSQQDTKPLTLDHILRLFKKTVIGASETYFSRKNVRRPKHKL